MREENSAPTNHDICEHQFILFVHMEVRPMALQLDYLHKSAFTPQTIFSNNVHKGCRNGQNTVSPVSIDTSTVIKSSFMKMHDRIGCKSKETLQQGIYSAMARPGVASVSSSSHLPEGTSHQVSETDT